LHGPARTVAQRPLDGNGLLPASTWNGAKSEIFGFATGKNHPQCVTAFYHMESDAVTFLINADHNVVGIQEGFQIAKAGCGVAVVHRLLVDVGGGYGPQYARQVKVVCHSGCPRKDAVILAIPVPPA
jgi:hypothetical protein